MTAATTATADAAELFRILSDPTRLEILRRLRRGEHCVCDLMTQLDAAQSRLSFHLKVLKDAGLVADRRDGRWAYYRMVPGALENVQAFIADLTQDPPSSPDMGSQACCD